MLLQPKVPLRTIPARGLWNADLGDSPAFDSWKTSESASTPSATAATSTAITSSTTALPEATRPAIVRPDHWLTRDVCVSRFHAEFAQYQPVGDESEHFPLVTSMTSVSQDIVDRARWLRPGEPWEELLFQVVDTDNDDENARASGEDEDEDEEPINDRPAYDEDDEENAPDAEELVGQDDFEALLRSMTEDEAIELLDQLNGGAAKPATTRGRDGGFDGSQAGGTDDAAFEHIDDEL
jgi:hypothetical protein